MVDNRRNSMFGFRSILAQFRRSSFCMEKSESVQFMDSIAEEIAMREKRGVETRYLIVNEMFIKTMKELSESDWPELQDGGDFMGLTVVIVRDAMLKTPAISVGIQWIVG